MHGDRQSFCIGAASGVPHAARGRWKTSPLPCTLRKRAFGSAVSLEDPAVGVVVDAFGARSRVLELDGRLAPYGYYEGATDEGQD